MLLLGTALAAELPLTLGDMPFNTQGAPSMQQSLELTWSLYRLGELGNQATMRRLFPDHEGLQLGVGIALSWTLPWFPLNGWMHEEWHRAVLTRNGVASFNGMWLPSNWAAGLVAVSRLSDQELAAFKADNPAGFVRMSSAGMEGQQALVRLGGDLVFEEADRHVFGPFWTADSWMAGTLVNQELQNLFYLSACLEASDALTEDINGGEPTMPPRDFTGLDCDGWAYDLARPDEPYADRGPHPSGNGIDRYRSWSDLGPTEQDWLKRARGMYLLNALNPNLFGVNQIRLGPARFNASVSSTLTPWGQAVELHTLWALGERTLVVDAGSGWNKAAAQPAVGVALRQQPAGGLTVDVEARVWLQPHTLLWAEEDRQPGGRLALELRHPVGPVDLRLQAEAKSPGWVLGEEALETQVGANAGLVVRTGPPRGS